ncbi:MAG: ROK family protein, partial [Aristaeellaceae bacterium]
MSNGVGGGVYSHGLVSGCINRAGEFGHCKVVPGGRQCKCGKKGCLERYAAGPGIRLTWKEMTGQDAEAADIAALARAGNADALALWKLEGEYLGRIIAMAANLLNPQKVIIGGGISLAFDLFEASLRATVEEQYYADPNHPLELLPTPLAYDRGLLAAAALAFACAQIRMHEKDGRSECRAGDSVVRLFCCHEDCAAQRLLQRMERILVGLHPANDHVQEHQVHVLDALVAFHFSHQACLTHALDLPALEAGHGDDVAMLLLGVFQRL